jgi:hypothetical protein
MNFEIIFKKIIKHKKKIIQIIAIFFIIVLIAIGFYAIYKYYFKSKSMKDIFDNTITYNSISNVKSIRIFNYSSSGLHLSGLFAYDNNGQSINLSDANIGNYFKVCQ